MEIVNIDKAGRIVILGTIRKKLNESSKLLIADIKNNLMIMYKEALITIGLIANAVGSAYIARAILKSGVKALESGV